VIALSPHTDTTAGPLKRRLVSPVLPPGFRLVKVTLLLLVGVVCLLPTTCGARAFGTEPLGPQLLSGEDSAAKKLPQRPAASHDLLSKDARRATPVTISSLLPTLLTCGLFLAGLGGISWWVKRHGPKRLRPLPKEAIEVLGRRSLDPRTTLHLVKVGQRLLVLGVGPDGVRTLSELTDPVEVEALAGTCRSPTATEGRGAAFALSLREALAGKLAGNDTDPAARRNNRVA